MASADIYLEEMDQPKLQYVSRSPLPLKMAWKKDPMWLWRGFDSKSQQFCGDPFVGLDGVLDHSLGMGGQSVRTSTTSSYSSRDHLAGSFSVSAGNALASVDAKVSYSKTVAENTDASKISTQASIRSGIVTSNADPKLSTEALALLMPTAGRSVQARRDAFHAAYGDYYVSGMVLGADNAVFASFQSYSASKSEELNVKIQVHFLGISAGGEINSLDEAKSSFAMITLEAFDSITYKHTSGSHKPSYPPSRTSDDDFNRLKDTAKRLLTDGANLDTRLQESLTSKISRIPLDIANHCKTPLSAADIVNLASGGFVVELILQPFEGVRDYVRTLCASPHF